MKKISEEELRELLKEYREKELEIKLDNDENIWLDL